MSNKIHTLAVKFAAVLIVPAVLAIATVAAWGAQPPPVSPSGALSEGVPSAKPAVKPAPAETVYEIPAIYVTAVRLLRAAKKAAKVRTCVDYPMYASGAEKVRICSDEDR